MLTYLHCALYSGLALWLLTGVGNGACRSLLSLTGMKEAMAATPEETYSAGRIIGWLERLILAIGIIAHSWEVLAAVIALKSVARFKELDTKLPAEYFLVGSLFSVFWAMLITGAWLSYDQRFGIHLRETAVHLLQPDKAEQKP